VTTEPREDVQVQAQPLALDPLPLAGYPTPDDLQHRLDNSHREDG
jgi:hypothetical protein